MEDPICELGRLEAVGLRTSAAMSLPSSISKTSMFPLYNVLEVSLQVYGGQCNREDFLLSYFPETMRKQSVGPYTHTAICILKEKAPSHPMDFDASVCPASCIIKIPG